MGVTCWRTTIIEKEQHAGSTKERPLGRAQNFSPPLCPTDAIALSKCGFVVVMLRWDLKARARQRVGIVRGSGPAPLPGDGMLAPVRGGRTKTGSSAMASGSSASSTTLASSHTDATSVRWQPVVRRSAT